MPRSAADDEGTPYQEREGPSSLGAQVFGVSAREVPDDQLDPYWQRLIQMWPAYQTFYEGGGNRSVFVLDPMGTP